MATFISNNPAETEAIGRRFAKECRCWIGFGAQRRTREWQDSIYQRDSLRDWEARVPVTSPTFTIIHEYPGGRLPVYHFDFFVWKIENRSRGSDSTIIFWGRRFGDRMGRPVSRIHSRAGALDFVRDKIGKRASDQHKMKILALELSTARGSLAWLNDDVDPVAREWPNDRKNSGAFFENLAQVRDQFGLPDSIIVGLGPGSYAGTRIAISAAIGLQAASRARLVGFPSICAIENEQTIASSEMLAGNRFSSRASAEQELIEGPSLFSEDELKSKLETLADRIRRSFVPNRCRNFRSAVIRYPSAELLAQLAQDSDRNFKLPPLEPIYLREPHITLPKASKNRFDDDEHSSMLG